MFITLRVNMSWTYRYLGPIVGAEIRLREMREPMNARRMTRQALPAGHDVEPTGDGLRAKLVTTGMAWLVVYLLLLTLFSIFEDQLAALTLPVRLLIVSGVLVTVMANVVMPMVTRIVAAWLGRKVNPEAGPCHQGGTALNTHTPEVVSVASRNDLPQQAIRTRTNVQDHV
jgi:hypothetical protein